MKKTFLVCAAIFITNSVFAMNKEVEEYFDTDTNANVVALCHKSNTSVIITIIGNTDSANLRALIKRIIRKNPQRAHYVEISESSGSLKTLLDAEDFASGDAFLKLHNPNTGWLGYVLSPHIINSWE